MPRFGTILTLPETSARSSGTAAVPTRTTGTAARAPPSAATRPRSPSWPTPMYPPGDRHSHRHALGGGHRRLRHRAPRHGPAHRVLLGAALHARGSRRGRAEGAAALGRPGAARRGHPERRLPAAGRGRRRSWGAVPHHEYTLWPREMGFRFLLRPLRPGEDPARVARTALPDEEAAKAVAARSLALDNFGERNRVDHLARGRPVEVQPASSSRYSAAGDPGLVDGIRGSIDRRGGHWQGLPGRRDHGRDRPGRGRSDRSREGGLPAAPGIGVYHPRASRWR